MNVIGVVKVLTRRLRSDLGNLGGEAKALRDSPAILRVNLREVLDHLLLGLKFV